MHAVYAGFGIFAKRTLRSAISFVALAAAMAASLVWNPDAAWAGGGGTGVNNTAGGGRGGSDGTLSSATGQNANPHSSSQAATIAVAGGGGAVDLTTGNGAPGGAEGTYGAEIYGTAGATGSTGLILTIPTTISSSISGGAGNMGQADVSGVNTKGGGGGGGVGISTTDDLTITGTGVVAGGSGYGDGASGGSGGGGVGIFSSSGVTIAINAGGEVVGGNGGGVLNTSRGGGGGGAAAILLTNGGVVQNAGTLTGGSGGMSAAGGGGDGAAGVQLLSGGTVINLEGGVIAGGAGGSMRILLPTAISTVHPGQGGVGITGADIAIVNAGTITGGAGGSRVTGPSWTPVDGQAIEFTGGVNSLEIWATSIIVGDVQAYSTADTFKLGGATDAIFDLSELDTKYTGFGLYEKTGSSTWTLDGTTTLVTPWTLSGGFLQISDDAALGDISGGLTFNGGGLRTTTDMTTSRLVTLSGNGTVSTDSGTTLTLSGVISGAGGLAKQGAGTLVLEGQNSYLGGTEIEDGVLEISSDANLGDASGGLTFDGGGLRTTADISSSRVVTLAGAGTIETDSGTTLSLSGLVSGAGGLVKDGSGTLLLEGDNAYAGATVVSAGTLLVAGDQSAARGLTSVASGAALGGTGTLGGDVAVADGGRLTPGLADGTAGTLAVAGSLSLSSGSVLDYNFGQAGTVGGSLNDLVTVGGDLVLDGTLNVSETAGGAFGPGVYRVISYAGSLTDNGLTLGAVPSGDYRVQTAIAGQVNLINSTGLTLNFWDGANGTANDGAIQGGDGVWSRSADEYWTTDTGDINAPYANGSFAVFGGEAGTVTVSNGDGAVEASGMQFMTGGYRIAGDALTLTGGASTIRVGDSTAAGASMTATIDAVLAGDSQLVKSDLGTLVLNGENTYGGGTSIEGGTVRIASDANLGAASGGLTLDGGTLHTTATLASARGVTIAGAGAFKVDDATVLTLSGGIEGSGGFTKQGTGTLLLSGASSYAGATDVEEGVLRAGAANALSSASAFSLAAGTELDLAGFSQTVASLSNAGTLRLSGEGVAGTVLTVAGDYAGDGGTVLINTVLGDDNSRTDRLVVSGGTSGSSTLRVSNVGGEGAQTVEGIKIVDVGGASEGSFQLAGDYVFEGDQAVVTGAYAYRLYKGGVSTPQDGDWYLRSSLTDPVDPQNPDDGNGGSGPSNPQPLYQPGVPVYEAYAGALQAFNQPGTLQQRMGNRSWGSVNGQQGNTATDAASGLGLWGRVEASGGSYSPETSTSGTDYDTSIWKLQAGADFLLSEQKSGRLVGSLSAHYGTIVSRIDSAHGHGRIESKGYGVDGALTWYGDNGLYADAQAHVTWYDSDLLSATAGRALTKGNDGLGYAVSLEAGQKIALDDAWSVTPQAQLSWSSVDYDGFTDPFGADVALDRSESLVGRLGVTVSHRAEWRDAAGLTNRSHLYGIGNIYYDFADGSRVLVGGTPFTGENAALWGGLGLGGTVDFADGKYSLYGEAQARTALESFGDSKVLSGTAGFRMRW